MSAKTFNVQNLEMHSYFTNQLTIRSNVNKVFLNGINPDCFACKKNPEFYWTCMFVVGWMQIYLSENGTINIYLPIMIKNILKNMSCENTRKYFKWPPIYSSKNANFGKIWIIDWISFHRLSIMISTHNL